MKSAETGLLLLQGSGIAGSSWQEQVTINRKIAVNKTLFIIASCYSDNFFFNSLVSQCISLFF